MNVRNAMNVLKKERFFLSFFNVFDFKSIFFIIKKILLKNSHACNFTKYFYSNPRILR